MTTENKLQSVTEKIRKDTPRLMEISEGCEINYKGLKYKIVKHLPQKLAEDVELVAIENIGEFPNVIYLCKYEDNFEIIGHEPMLNDVLEWVKSNQFFIDDLYVDNDGFFGLLDFCYEKFKSLKLQWDFSKPYLKDQTEELIEFLFNLIKE